MLRKIFSNSMLAILALSLLLVGASPDQASAQLDQGFNGQDNYDTLFSGKDSFGNDHDTLQREVDQGRAERERARQEHQRQLDAARKAQQERERTQREAAEKQKMLDEYKRQDEANHKNWTNAFQGVYRRKADELGTNFPKYVDQARQEIMDMMSKPGQTPDQRKILRAALEALNKEELRHRTNMRSNPSFFDQVMDVIQQSQSTAPPQQMQPVIKVATRRPPPITDPREMVKRQQEVWVREADDAYGNNVPREIQIRRFTTEIASRPEYYGQEPLIEPRPVRTLRSGDGGIFISDGDLYDTGRTNEILEEAVARQEQYNKTQVRPLLISSATHASAPQYTPFAAAVSEPAQSIEVVTTPSVVEQPVVRTAPAVVTRRVARPVVRTGVAAATTAAIVRETVRPRVVAPVRRAAVVAAPVVRPRVIRPRVVVPTVRVRPRVVGTRRVVRRGRGLN